MKTLIEVGASGLFRALPSSSTMSGMLREAAWCVPTWLHRHRDLDNTAKPERLQMQTRNRTQTANGSLCFPTIRNKAHVKSIQMTAMFFCMCAFFILLIHLRLFVSDVGLTGWGGLSPLNNAVQFMFHRSPTTSFFSSTVLRGYFSGCTRPRWPLMAALGARWKGHSPLRHRWTCAAAVFGECAPALGLVCVKHSAEQSKLEWNIEFIYE